MAVEVCVKAAIGSPISSCHKVLSTLEEKNISYKFNLIDTTAKPTWFLEASPEGKVPVAKFDENWAPYSDAIVEILEEKYPEKASPPASSSCVGSQIFPSLVKFLRSEDPNDGLEHALLEELEALDEHLKKLGPFVARDMLTAVDLSLAPKLYHVEITTDYFKYWSIPAVLTHLHNYMKLLFSRESFQKTRAPNKYVIAGWEQKLMRIVPHRMAGVMATLMNEFRRLGIVFKMDVNFSLEWSLRIRKARAQAKYKQKRSEIEDPQGEYRIPTSALALFDKQYIRSKSEAKLMRSLKRKHGYDGSIIVFANPRTCQKAGEIAKKAGFKKANQFPTLPLHYFINSELTSSELEETEKGSNEWPTTSGSS